MTRKIHPRSCRAYVLGMPHYVLVDSDASWPWSSNFFDTPSHEGLGRCSLSSTACIMWARWRVSQSTTKSISVGGLHERDARRLRFRQTSCATNGPHLRSNVFLPLDQSLPSYHHTCRRIAQRLDTPVYNLNPTHREHLQLPVSHSLGVRMTKSSRTSLRSFLIAWLHQAPARQHCFV